MNTDRPSPEDRSVFPPEGSGFSSPEDRI